MLFESNVAFITFIPLKKPKNWELGLGNLPLSMSRFGSQRV